MSRRLLCFVATLVVGREAQCRVLSANPASLRSVLASLRPGDVLDLSAGLYPPLEINHLRGTEARPIVIAGPENACAAIVGSPGRNTVEITESSYVVLERLRIDSKNEAGAFGVSAKGLRNRVDHITIRHCSFVGQGASQQTVAISTKTPTWGWVIRENLIDGAGTGMYLGDSDGSAPFVAGTIEGNVIRNTVGYNLEIKQQVRRPLDASLPSEANRTIIRNNLFIKDGRPSPDGDRPNVMIGGLPEDGPGVEDIYEIYGNLFFENPRGALLRASGRVTIHDNVLVTGGPAAVLLGDGERPLAMARIYNNTIYARDAGIRFDARAQREDFVVGNLVFAKEPIAGPIAVARDNLTDDSANAGQYVRAPALALDEMDFRPKPGRAVGSTLDLSPIQTDTGYDTDFNGDSKGRMVFRGAYAGEGEGARSMRALELLRRFESACR